ncbi:Flp family type IVb pilin [Jannaschia sp. 2305UL9-9]|uniref:Flp family type IVb pilin n=1 Tax=Jannaschia sp. 2305UL9-9 TaxID=3121638 RepID=UPI0035271E35
MLNAIKTFSADESGAVTVDWVVLTAALVGLGLAVMGVISGGIESLSNDINGVLLTDHTSTSF